MSTRAASSLKTCISRQLVSKPAVPPSVTNKLFSTAPKATSKYVSPYNDLFKMMKIQKPSSGTSTTESEIPKLKCGIPETVLKFRTTCYDRLHLAPFVQTNEYKVTLEVNMKYLPLATNVETEIFHQIVGTRFNEERGELKLTCDQFASRIENKRHLCSMLDRIIIGAKRLAAETK